MEHVYVLQEYEYDSYSYSGISPSHSHLHATKEGAEEHAKNLKVSIVEYCQDPNKQATLEECRVLP